MKQCKFKLVVLLLLLVIIAIPLTISALDETPVARVRKVVSLRSTNSETYLLSDGTYECVIYAYDKYYYDNTGSLRQIDNALILDESSTKADSRHYKNRANRFDVSFSDTVTPTVTMVQDGQKLTFSAESATGGNPFHTTAD